eukprot:gene29375-38458_t
MTALLKIVKLDETVINRIAAGEVVQRPSAALKEMLENSLDAGATCITVIAKGGGMQLLQITDNGHGIAKEDMPIACERFTTSKLTTFEDLKSISTFGFRGEAATYSDGHIVATKAGEKAEPKPTAGTTGTTITVEDLFYNMPTRRQAFKNLNEEYQRILDVITKYSIHYGDKKISFTCKKYGQNTPDLHCPVNPTSNTLENIKVAFGSSIARELISFSCSTTTTASSSSSSSNDGNGEVLSVSVEGKVTNANYSHKKAIYIIFINNRLVECASIRRTIENVYTGILPKHMHPFVYLSIQMPPQHIDVNVHPTKKEVHFLFEEELLELIHVDLTKLLSSANESRSFLIQTTLFDPSSNNNLLSSDKPGTVQAHARGNPSSGENIDDLETNDFSLSKFHSRGSSSLQGDSNKPVLSLQEFSNDSSGGAHIQQQGKEVASNRKSGAVSEPVALGTKRTSSSNSSAKVTGNKMIRTDPNLMKINSFFLKTTTGVAKTNIEVADAGKESSINPETGVEAPPVNPNSIPNELHDRGLVSSSAIQQPQKEAPFSFAKNRKGACLCCDGQPDPATHVEGPTDEPRKDMQVPSAFKLPAPIVETLCPYLSIRGMINDMHKNKSSTMESILKGNTFVGVVSDSLSLVQWGTKLLLVNHTALARSLFFQLAIRRFAEHPVLELSEAVNIEEFVLAALEEPRLAHLRPSPPSTARKVGDDRAGFDPQEDVSGGGYDIQRIAKGTALLLWEKADMLREYFKIGVENVSGQYMLTSLPALLERYEPLPQELPEFLLRLAADTIWTDE